MIAMQSIEIDPELNRLALAEAAEQHPEFAEHALRIVARPLPEDSPGNSSGRERHRLGNKRGSFKTRRSGHTRGWRESWSSAGPVGYAR